MKTSTIASTLALLALALAFQLKGQEITPPGPGAGGHPGVATQFFYQGQLLQNGAPAEGLFDLKFSLLNAAGGEVASPVIVESVLVEAGIVSVPLNFGRTPFTEGGAAALRALTGRVYVRATASNGAIRPGDLLTSSTLPGHAMKATDHGR